MDDEDLQRLAARADIARLLAACFYEPTGDLLDEGVFAAITDAAARCDDGLHARAQALEPAFREQPLDLLRVDYTRLFLGPEGALAQPYGSVWLSAAQPLVSESTLDVEALYAQAGFALEDDFNDLPDHVAVELEFLYAQLFREAVARRDGDATTAQSARAAQRELLTAHVGRWCGPFTRALSAAAATRYYRALADLTEAFVAAETRRQAGGSGAA